MAQGWRTVSIIRLRHPPPFPGCTLTLRPTRRAAPECGHCFRNAVFLCLNLNDILALGAFVLDWWLRQRPYEMLCHQLLVNCGFLCSGGNNTQEIFIEVWWFWRVEEGMVREMQGYCILASEWNIIRLRLQLLQKSDGFSDCSKLKSRKSGPFFCSSEDYFFVSDGKRNWDSIRTFQGLGTWSDSHLSESFPSELSIIREFDEKGCSSENECKIMEFRQGIEPPEAKSFATCINNYTWREGQVRITADFPEFPTSIAHNSDQCRKSAIIRRRMGITSIKKVCYNQKKHWHKIGFMIICR